MPVHHRLRFLTFPMRASRLCSLWPDMRPLRFRRAPFGRDGTLDPGGATASRIAMPHILPSTVPSVSASATFFLSWLNPPPHPITVYASHPSSPTTAQHRFPAARYHLTGAGLSSAGTRQLRLTHRNRRFESSSLQQTVRLLQDFSFLCRKAGSCRGVRGPGRAARPAETRRARQHHANCR